MDSRGGGFEAPRAQSAVTVGVSKLLRTRGPSSFHREVKSLVKRQEVAVKGGRSVGPCACTYTEKSLPYFSFPRSQRLQEFLQNEESPLSVSKVVPKIAGIFCGTCPFWGLGSRIK